MLLGSVGAILVVAALLTALVPYRRLESISQTVAPTSTAVPTAVASPPPRATPTATPALVLQHEVRTEKALPDSVIATFLVAGATLLVAAAFFGRITEFSIGGLKVSPIVHAAAEATLDKAREAGVLDEPVTPEKVAELVHQTADAAAEVERKFLQGTGGRRISLQRAGSAGRDEPAYGPISPRLLQAAAKDAVDAVAEEKESTPKEQ